MRAAVAFSFLRTTGRVLVGGLALAASPGRAKDAAPDPAAVETRKIDGIFNTDLPTTERKGSVRLIVHPHFGDFTHRDYLRVPIGVRWGWDENTETSVTAESYFQNPFRHAPTGNGIGDVEFGFKRRVLGVLPSKYDTSAGLNVFIPVGRPPIDMTTGYERFSPYVVVGRDVPSRPGLKVFLNGGFNFLRRSSVPGMFQPNNAHSNSFVITPGFVYDHYPYHTTLEVEFESTALIGRENRSFVTFRPGFAWDLPRTLTFNSNGRWLIGVGLHFTTGPDGFTTGGGGKIRGEFGISRWFRRDPAKTNPSAPAEPGR